MPKNFIVCEALQPELDDVVSAYLEDKCEENLRRIFVAGSALVHHYGNLYSGNCLSEDIIQAGYEGLMKAVQRFDPGRGVRFVTFASHYIMGEMKRHLRQEASFDRPGWVADLHWIAPRSCNRNGSTGRYPREQSPAEPVQRGVLPGLSLFHYLRFLNGLGKCCS
jgi:hypothetical protein